MANDGENESPGAKSNMPVAIAGRGGFAIEPGGNAGSTSIWFSAARK